jgi:osmotically-inducible protein OsmY
MVAKGEVAVESPRLEAIVRHRTGWEVDDLEVLVDGRGLTLRGHARSAFARARAAEEAAVLAGLPVVANEMTVD